jgi:hypothetical protein
VLRGVTHQHAVVVTRRAELLFLPQPDVPRPPPPASPFPAIAQYKSDADPAPAQYKPDADQRSPAPLPGHFLTAAAAAKPRAALLRRGRRCALRTKFVRERDPMPSLQAADVLAAQRRAAVSRVAAALDAIPPFDDWKSRDVSPPPSY